MQKLRQENTPKPVESVKHTDDLALKEVAAKAATVAQALEPELDEVGQLLMKAADYIEKHGWCQHTLWSGHQSCALGGIARAFGRSENRSWSWNYFGVDGKALKRLESEVGGMVPYFNDRPGTTKEMVLEKMRAAARRT